MPFIARRYTNSQYGAALEGARRGSKGEFGRRLGILEDFFRGLFGSWGKHTLFPPFGDGDSGANIAPEPDTPPGAPPGFQYAPRPLLASEVIEAKQQNSSTPNSGEQSHRAQARDASDGHWVTIDHRHVFIQESKSNHAEHAHGSAQHNQRRREEIADIAKEYDHSTAWAFNKKKDDFPAGSNKCNKFVYDVTNEAGAKATVIGSDGKARPPLAAEWADPHTRIPNWRVLHPGETPQPGDVTAWPFHYSDATGHSGIVTSVDRSGRVTAMAAHESVVGPDGSFNPSHAHPKVTYRRYTGE